MDIGHSQALPTWAPLEANKTNLGTIIFMIPFCTARRTQPRLLTLLLPRCCRGLFPKFGCRPSAWSPLAELAQDGEKQPRRADR